MTADPDLETLLRFALALAAVLALILGIGWVMRRLAARGLLPDGLFAAPPGREPRLSIIEARQLDVRRRLVLVRRDNVEHLLLLGANGETVIESAIPSAVEAEPMETKPVRPSP